MLLYLQKKKKKKTNIKYQLFYFGIPLKYKILFKIHVLPFNICRYIF